MRSDGQITHAVFVILKRRETKGEREREKSKIEIERNEWKKMTYWSKFFVYVRNRKLCVQLYSFFLFYCIYLSFCPRLFASALPVNTRRHSHSMPWMCFHFCEFHSSCWISFGCAYRHENILCVIWLSISR